MSSNECEPKLEISQRYISRRSQTCIFSVSPFFTLHENVRFGSEEDVKIVCGTYNESGETLTHQWLVIKYCGYCRLPNLVPDPLFFGLPPPLAIAETRGNGS